MIVQACHSRHKLESKVESSVNEKPILSPFLLVPCKSGYDVVYISDIIMIQAEGNYSILYRNNGTTYFMSKTLKTVENQIDHSGFCRIHQSYLINMRFIRRINSGKNIALEMVNGLKARVSRSKRKLFRTRLMSL